jgi:NADH-quinone oxidoreductase subunit N
MDFTYLIGNDTTQSITFYIYLITSVIICLTVNKNNYYWWFDAETILIFLSTAATASWLICTQEVITFYTILELQSILTYILISKYKSRKSLEATIKYFILSSSSSFFILLGFSFIYYVTGSTTFEDWIVFLSMHEKATDLMIYTLSLGFIFIASGLFFKIYAVPFHFWTIDIYGSLPYNILIYMVSIPNVVFYFLFYKFHEIFMSTPYELMMGKIIYVVIIASGFIGTIGALYQQNLKKIIAFSSVANVSYLLCIIHICNPMVMRQELFNYLFFYNITNIGILMLSAYISGLHQKSVSNLPTLGRLRNHEILLAGYLALFFYTLAGLPPFGLFFAKISIIAYTLMTHTVLSFFLIIITLISAFYYAQLIKNMFFYWKEKHERRIVYFVKPSYIPIFLITLILFINIFYGVYPTLLSSLTSGGVLFM